jgi:hypothetical protein
MNSDIRKSNIPPLPITLTILARVIMKPVLQTHIALQPVFVKKSLIYRANCEAIKTNKKLKYFLLV